MEISTIGDFIVFVGINFKFLQALQATNLALNPNIDSATHIVLAHYENTPIQL